MRYLIGTRSSPQEPEPVISYQPVDRPERTLCCGVAVAELILYIVRYGVLLFSLNKKLKRVAHNPLFKNRVDVLTQADLA